MKMIMLGRCNLYCVYIFIVYWFCSCAGPTRLSNRNIVSIYSLEKPKFQVKTNILRKSNNLEVYLKIEKMEFNEIEEMQDKKSSPNSDTTKIRIQLVWKLLRGFENKKMTASDTLVFPIDYISRNYVDPKSELDNVSITQSEADYMFKIPVPVENHALLHLTLKEFVYLPSKSRRSESQNMIKSEINSCEQFDLIYKNDPNKKLDYLLCDSKIRQPVFRNYYYVDDTVFVEYGSPDKYESAFKVHKFIDTFITAPPPMASLKQVFEKDKSNTTHQLVADSTFTFSIGQPVQFPSKGTYLFSYKEAKSREQSQFAIRVVDEHFPGIIEPSELIQPLAYISTKDEYIAMKSSANQKQAIDDFWLKIAKDKIHARNMIREYYKRVERANILFSTYKDGWKTDRGMIYLVFGEPQGVYKTDQEEVWEYFHKMEYQNIVFRFVRKPNSFSQNQFDLIRSSNYIDIWYIAIDQWRSGILKKR